jgi:hypothetical protein
LTHDVEPETAAFVRVALAWERAAAAARACANAHVVADKRHAAAALDGDAQRYNAADTHAVDAAAAVAGVWNAAETDAVVASVAFADACGVSSDDETAAAVWWKTVQPKTEKTHKRKRTTRNAPTFGGPKPRADKRTRKHGVGLLCVLACDVKRAGAALDAVSVFASGFSPDDGGHAAAWALVDTLRVAFVRALADATERAAAVVGRGGVTADAAWRCASRWNTAANATVSDAAFSLADADAAADAVGADGTDRRNADVCGVARDAVADAVAAVVSALADVKRQRGDVR